VEQIHDDRDRARRRLPLRERLVGVADRHRHLDDAQIVALYGDDQDGELLDHRTDDLLPRGTSYAYFDWPIVPGRHHLVEGVLGPTVRR
jgi:hypothetical protein